MSFFYVLSPNSTTEDEIKEMFNSDCTVSILLEEIESWIANTSKKARQKKLEQSTRKLLPVSKSGTTEKSVKASNQNSITTSQLQIQNKNESECEEIKILDLFDSAGNPMRLNEHATLKASEFIQSRQIYSANYRGALDPIPAVQPSTKNAFGTKTVKK
ncbi:uncharacterized protein MONOS_14144 [Monocercomonoides exilis]|uniref:uncharacterized protein n=1 Tax=Monocercomonoides exilis TaxID=2049356 RepID=UPI00355A35F6|nr:hypothetical protein MONOS_14144 [Monocercomonoides exilis]|eukprot:MONOS_14144.1-p1 / transcript=MONOS_14144.1 / gene=MONOS_14144 / organism=Monocercomonoides_exilis_PA203 / gene_product=unspecified product / transcript_product=unspecified product / location=Mono_scaffold00946:351-894(-) / protein_length=159 / sequence_SO=supercontig / SO=protein_coding / is_pseudo=false